MDKRRLAMLAAAAALLVLAALFSRGADQPSEAARAAQQASEERPKVRYPRDNRRFPPKRVVKAPADQPQPRTAATDPIQNAMAMPNGGAVFVEVNAIRHSDIVQKLLRCREADASQNLDFMRDELGIDPLEDVDRVALHEDLIAVSGYFDELKLPDEVVRDGAYGDNAELFTLPNPDEPGETMHLGKMGDGLLVMGENEDDVKAAVDRAEGRGEPAQPLPPHMVRGSEVYGRFGGDLVRELLGGAKNPNPMVQRAAEIITEGTVRVLVDDHLSLSLDLETSNEQEGEDLAKALAGVIAATRAQAESAGEDDVAALLKQARVLPGKGGEFGVDFAVPGDLILEAMECGEASPAPASDEPE
jgi:hypothetical protein